MRISRISRKDSGFWKWNWPREGIIFTYLTRYWKTFKVLSPVGFLLYKGFRCQVNAIFPCIHYSSRWWWFVHRQQWWWVNGPSRFFGWRITWNCIYLSLLKSMNLKEPILPLAMFTFGGLQWSSLISFTCLITTVTSWMFSFFASHV